MATIPSLPLVDQSVAEDPGLPPAPGEESAPTGTTSGGRFDVDADFDAQIAAAVEREAGRIAGELAPHPLRSGAPVPPADVVEELGTGQPPAPAPDPDLDGGTDAAPPVAPAADEAAPVADGDRFSFEYGGQQFELDQAGAAELASVYEYHQRNADLWPIMEAVRAGDVVALARTDYEQLVALVKAQSAPAAPAAAPAPQVPRVDPSRTMDPELAEAFNRQAEVLAALQQQLTQQQAPASAAAEPAVPRPLFDPAQAAAQQQLAQLERVVTTTVNRFAEQYGLTQPEVDRLLDIAARSGDAQRLEAEQRSRAPWAQVDYEAVYSGTLHRAMVTDPSLRARYEATLRSAPAAPAAAPATPSPVASVAAKRARASSLASVPAAATPAPVADVTSLNDRQVEAGIAAELRALMAQG